MKRQPTISINKTAVSLSKIVPATLGDCLSFVIDKERREIYITKQPGGHMVLVTYPAALPIIKSQSLINWIRKELGKCDLSRMPVQWDADGEKFIVKPGVKS